MSNLSRRESVQFLEWCAGLAAVAVLAWASAGPAASADAVKSSPTAAEAAKGAQPGLPPCASGDPRDDSGACPVVDDAPATRGFELFSGALPHAGARAAPATSAADGRPAVGATTAVCRDICDLKVNFRSGSATLTPSAQGRLDQFAKAVGSTPSAGGRFEVGAHTDASGSPARNLSLSQARAQAVTAYLASHGVPATRLIAKGYGSEGLLLRKAPFDARNRRVEARVLR